MNKPNILFIFTDQQRKFDIRCYGNDFVKTPHLDELASQGLRFEHCLSNSPVCVPARATLLTGLFATKHKALLNDMKIDTSCRSIADVLNEQGYHTGYMGKWHLGGFPRDKAIPKEDRLGFSTWKVANCNHDYLDTYYYDENDVRHDVAGYEPEIFGSLALDFVGENKERPWALYLSIATPHDPFDAIPPEHLKPYADCNIQLRPNTKDEVRFINGRMMPIDEYKEMVRGYFGHVAAIDEQIGLIVERLKATGQYDDTIIIYSSDHGDMLGSQGERDKQTPYEESVAIPLIAFWKDRIYSGVCDELIGLNDLPVSIAALVGAELTDTDGEDLSRLFLEPNTKSYDSAYLYDFYPAHQGERKGKKAWRAVRTKRYTYAVHADDLNWLLFDNESDPYQLNNLAGKADYAEIQNTLKAMLFGHIEKHDKLLDGLDFIRYIGATNEFNASQRYFGMNNFA